MGELPWAANDDGSADCLRGLVHTQVEGKQAGSQRKANLLLGGDLKNFFKETDICGGMEPHLSKELVGRNEKYELVRSILYTIQIHLTTVTLSVSR